MKKRIILGVFSFALAAVFSVGIFHTASNAATSGGSGGHPTFKSPMVNYVPNHVSFDPGKSMYSISYEYNVSGISNAKD